MKIETKGRKERKIIIYSTIILCNQKNKFLTAEAFYDNATYMPKTKHIEKGDFSTFLRIRKDIFEGKWEDFYDTWRLKEEIYENLDRENVINYNPEKIGKVLEEIEKAMEKNEETKKKANT